MPQPKKGERVLGPYPGRDGWRCIFINARGERRTRVYETRAQALAARRKVEAEVNERSSMTVGEALDAYEVHQREKGNKPTSINETMRRLRVFFPDEGVLLAQLDVDRAVALYERFRTRTTAKGTSISVDYQRNTLLQARSFLKWCVEKQKLIPMNPFAGVEGKGKRRHGKPQLRIDEARKWIKKACELADAGEAGAVAAMLTLMLGMRCSEIVSRVVRDVDDEGRLLCIPASKTEAGRRTLEVPATVRPYLQGLVKNRPGDALLFGKHCREWPRDWVQKICVKAKVPKVTAHGMRGLHSTLAVARGVTGHEVAAALGHESFATTARSYARPEAVRGAQQRRVEDVLGDGTEAAERNVPQPFRNDPEEPKDDA